MSHKFPLFGTPPSILDRTMCYHFSMAAVLETGRAHITATCSTLGLGENVLKLANVHWEEFASHTEQDVEVRTTTKGYTLIVLIIIALLKSCKHRIVVQCDGSSMVRTFNNRCSTRGYYTVEF